MPESIADHLLMPALRCLANGHPAGCACSSACIASNRLREAWRLIDERASLSADLAAATARADAIAAERDEERKRREEAERERDEHECITGDAAFDDGWHKGHVRGLEAAGSAMTIENSKLRARADRAETALLECQGREAVLRKAAEKARDTLRPWRSATFCFDTNEALDTALAAPAPRVVVLSEVEARACVAHFDAIASIRDVRSDATTAAKQAANEFRARLAPDSAPGERRATT